MEYTGTITLEDNPTIIPRPFAYTNGTRADIPQSDSELPANTNRASYKTGFPPRTSMSLQDEGIPPARFDFNGLGYDVSSWITYFQNGGVVQFDQTVANSIGGYPENARLWVLTDNGTIIVRAKQSTSVNPATEVSAIFNNTSNNWALDIGGGVLLTKLIQEGSDYIMIYSNGWCRQGGQRNGSGSHNWMRPFIGWPLNFGATAIGYSQQSTVGIEPWNGDESTGFNIAWVDNGNGHWRYPNFKWWAEGWLPVRYR